MQALSYCHMILVCRGNSQEGTFCYKDIVNSINVKSRKALKEIDQNNAPQSRFFAAAGVLSSVNQ